MALWVPAPGEVVFVTPNNMVRIRYTLLKIPCRSHSYFLYRSFEFGVSTRAHNCPFLKKDFKGPVYSLFSPRSDHLILVCRQAMCRHDGMLISPKLAVSLLVFSFQLAPPSMHNQNKICESAVQVIKNFITEPIHVCMDQLASRSVMERKKIDHNIRKLRALMQEYASLLNSSICWVTEDVPLVIFNAVIMIISATSTKDERRSSEPESTWQKRLCEIMLPKSDQMYNN